MTDGLALDQLKARRRELQEVDDAVSYVRRVAQGRADLAKAELARRGAHRETDLDLRHVLGDHLLGASERPPRPVEDQSDHPRAVELDQLCAELGFGRLDELDDEALAELVAALDSFEARISDERRQVYAELDDLTDELVRLYAEQTDIEDDDS